MAWRSSGATLQELISNLQHNRVIHSERVAAAMLEVDRGDFCVDRRAAYADCPQPIGHGATISAPHMHALVLEHLNDKLVPGARVLDVGSGSGILAAMMGRMVTPGGVVYGIDHVPALVEWSLENMSKNRIYRDMLQNGTVHLSVGDGFVGLPNAGPFDAIHVGAAAAETPQALLDQLAEGGRLIIPVGRFNQELVQFDKHSNGRVTHKALCGVMYVPLTTREKQERGVA